MDGLRNPFAVRDGSIILIEDLDLSQRGLKFQCQCPACNGNFIAKMGDVKDHHFAHSKDACDEVVAYTSGLYKLIQQILSSGVPFYIPALAVAYTFSNDGIIPEGDVKSCVKLVHESYNGSNKLVVSKEKYIVFDNAELCLDNKNRIEALELVVRGSKMAIKVMPPDTLCKTATVSPHKDMATLVVDFTDDADMIQASDSKAFQKYLLSEHLSKWWRYNPKIEGAFPQILELSKKAHADYIERQKKITEQKRLAAQQRIEARKIAAQEYAVRIEMERKSEAERRAADEATKNRKREERLALGYAQVKDKFVQQETPIHDSTGLRWVQCEVCGEIKDETAFPSYGGINRVNLGVCSKCSSERER